jgi:DedD protein
MLKHGIMAERTSSDDEFNPRHRIVGAVILVALAVIFLPLLLSDRPPEDTARTGSAELPIPETRVIVTPVPVPGEKPATRNVSVDKPAADKTTRTVDVPLEPASPTTASAPTVATEPAPSPAKAEPKAEPKPARTAVSKPAAGQKVWLVQVGVFSQPENAHRLQEKLKARGYTVLLDPPNAEKGKNVRVEVGPYPDQAAARAAATRIQSELGVKGVVRSQ